MATDPKKTQYINLGRALATDLCNVLKRAMAFTSEYELLGFDQNGADPVTQEDLDAATAGVYPPGGPGSLSMQEWIDGIFAIGKNGSDYKGGEDKSLLSISS